MHIKICGLTNLDDALAAVEAGADYLGFNFYTRSPRYITPEACGRLQAGLARRGAPATTVGVFVNSPTAEVAAVLDGCGLQLAQLHGDERPEHLTLLWGRAFKVLREPAALSGAELETLSVFSPSRPAFLVDALAPNLYGGSGQLADWPAAARIAARYPIFLAGGLNPDNVAQAVEQVRPWGVDAASGVESAPGKKDHARIAAFVAAAREAAGRASAIRPPVAAASGQS
jgi:phosphoribosylanthranilate isomerase